MTARLGAVIESTLRAPGVVTAVVVDSAGHAIEGGSWTQGDLAATARSASDTLKQWVSVGTELRIGAVRSMLIERCEGPVVISPASGGSAFVLVGSSSCPPGRLRHTAGVARDALAEITRSGTTAADRRIEHADTVDQAGRSSGQLTAGEVVLVGAHTFRLVTRLVARLLQTKGVRSSRLRAYSPGSTIIDVLLEEGATLAAIGHNCLGDLPIERTAEEQTRLVLRAAKEPLGVPTPIGSPG